MQLIIFVFCFLLIQVTVDLDVVKIINNTDNIEKNCTASYSAIEDFLNKPIESQDSNKTLTTVSSSSSECLLSKSEFHVEAYNFFRIKSHSQSSLSHSRVNSYGNLNRSNRLASFLNKEIKKYLSHLNQHNKSDESSGRLVDEYSNEPPPPPHSRDDVIPFDDCEYEKIVSTRSATATNSYSPKKIAALVSKSLSSLSTMNSASTNMLISSQTHLMLNNSTESSGSSASGSLLSRTSVMSSENLNLTAVDAPRLQASQMINSKKCSEAGDLNKMKTSRTESEISSKYSLINCLLGKGQLLL